MPMRMANGEEAVAATRLPGKSKPIAENSRSRSGRWADLGSDLVAARLPLRSLRSGSASRKALMPMAM